MGKLGRNLQGCFEEIFFKKPTSFSILSLLQTLPEKKNYSICPVYAIKLCFPRRHCIARTPKIRQLENLPHPGLGWMKCNAQFIAPMELKTFQVFKSCVAQPPNGRAEQGFIPICGNGGRTMARSCLHVRYSFQELGQLVRARETGKTHIWSVHLSSAKVEL